MSADPVREAAQELIEALNKLPGFPYAFDVQSAIRALRTTLAAPEGPAPEPVAWVDERAIAWLAQRLGKQSFITTVLEAKKSFERPMPLYATTAPEAPPPVEARQPQTGEPWDGIKYLLDSYPGAVRCRYKGLDEDLLASLSVTFIGLRDAARAALAAPAGAGEREALRELIAACDAQDEWRMTPTSLRMNLSAVEAYDIGNRVDLAWTAARAALSVSPPGPEIQPHLDHQVGAQVTPLPLESAGGAPSATASREHEASEHCWCEPEVDYVDPNTGAKVFVHKQTQ